MCSSPAQKIGLPSRRPRKRGKAFERLANACEQSGLVSNVGLDPEAERPAGTGERERIVRGQCFGDADAAGDGVHVVRAVGRWRERRTAQRRVRRRRQRGEGRRAGRRSGE